VRRACDRAFPVPDELVADPQAATDWQHKHRWGPNQLRHLLATRVRRESGIEVAKTLLGHSQLNTTGIYAEIDRAKAVEVIRQIG
jgi:site-specific recombinase XerD